MQSLFGEESLRVSDVVWLTSIFSTLSTQWGHTILATIRKNLLHSLVEHGQNLIQDCSCAEQDQAKRQVPEVAQTQSLLSAETYLECVGEVRGKVITSLQTILQMLKPISLGDLTTGLQQVQEVFQEIVFQTCRAILLRTFIIAQPKGILGGVA